jgi:spoIIIJ-associated protein
MEEVTVKAKTVDEALKKGAELLGKRVEDVDYAILGESKKGFLKMFGSEVEVKVYCDGTNSILEDSGLSKSKKDNTVKENRGETSSNIEEKVVEFLNMVISDMRLNAKASVERVDEKLSKDGKSYDKDIRIVITGNGLGMLIGRHGDVLDALQYLANIFVGRCPKNDSKQEYIRVIIDIENYRAKREETLKALTRRVSSKVLATGRNFTLEPMSAYERRIIHSEAQHIKGVHTFSIGTESSRRVVIAYGEDVDNVEDDE